ncbi:MAG: TolC family protein [Xanthomonadales bacterium]|nr:TolC family protein [Xanthomonadales bacterium]
MLVLHSLRRRCSFRCWAALVFALSFVAAPAWSAAPIAFDDAVRLAVERAPALQARRSQTEAAREDAARAAALPDPRLTLGLTNVPVTGTDAFDLHADDMTMKQVGVMQEFPAWAKRQARRAVADRMIEQTQALTLVERLAVRQAAAQAWIALWTAQREVEALQAQREQSALAISIAKARLAGGTGTAADALAAQSAALELDNRIDAAEADVAAARATLARWLGIEPEELTIIGASPDLTVLSIDESSLLTSVARQGPLLAWQSRESVAEAAVAAAVAETRPDWSVSAMYGQRERTSGGMPRSDMLSIEFSIGLPLLTRNRQDRGVAARRAELDAVAAEHEDARRMQVEAVRRGLAEWHGLKRQIARKEQQALPLAHDRSQVALAAYRGGGSLQPWLDARRDELELHIEHARHLGELGRVWSALAYLLDDEETQP